MNDIGKVVNSEIIQFSTAMLEQMAVSVALKKFQISKN